MTVVPAPVDPSAHLRDDVVGLGRTAVGVRPVVDSGQTGRLACTVADVEVLAEGPSEVDDAEEEEDQDGRDERELDEHRSTFTIRVAGARPGHGAPVMVGVVDGTDPLASVTEVNVIVAVGTSVTFIWSWVMLQTPFGLEVTQDVAPLPPGAHVPVTVAPMTGRPGREHRDRHGHRPLRAL